MSVRRLAVIPLAALLTACPPARGTDDDDAAGGDFGGLDRNSDGVLDAADVDPGEGASFVSFDFDEDGETGQEPGDKALETTSVNLFAGFEAWTLEASFPSGTPDLNYSLSLRFENLGTISPGIGAGDVTNGSMRPTDQSWYAYRNEPGGQVEITAATETTASGFFSGPATLDVLGQFEEPTGETVVIHGFAFNNAPLVVDTPGR